MYFITTLTEDGESGRLNYDIPADARLKYNELRASKKYAVLELWREGDPGQAELEFRYAKLLAAWDSDAGNLNPDDFCRRPNSGEALAWMTNAISVSF